MKPRKKKKKCQVSNSDGGPGRRKRCWKSLAKAGIETSFDRAEKVKPCPIGSDGACCKICAMGPCRLVGKVKAGICGATWTPS